MASRSRVVMLAIGLVALVGIVGLFVGGEFGSHGGDDAHAKPQIVLPPVASGLLPWAPRGLLASDHTLVQQATAVWRGGAPRSTDFPSDELSSARPGATVYLLWAGTIGAGRVVVLQSVATDGMPAVAQVAEHGDPAALTLDAVAHLPATMPPALAITYDGNLNMPSLSPGPGAALIQLLVAPPSVLPLTGVWEQGSADQLQLLENEDGGMTATFLQLGDDPPTPTTHTPVVLANATGGRAGVEGTVDVRGGQLVPSPARFALRDVSDWGPSGRIQGTEYADLDLAAAHTSLTTTPLSATVVAAASASLANGDVVAVRLLAVLGPSNEPVETLVAARDQDGTLLCWALVAVATVAGDGGPTPVPPTAGEDASADGHVPVLAGRCASSTGGFVATLAAAEPGAGTVALSGTGADALSGGDGEPSVVLRVDPYPAGVSDTAIARLIDSAGHPVDRYGASIVMPPLVGGA